MRTTYDQDQEARFTVSTEAQTLFTTTYYEPPLKKSTVSLSSVTPSRKLVLPSGTDVNQATRNLLADMAFLRCPVLQTW